MKVTAAIVTRNRSKKLEKCLFSLIRQTEKPFEVLVIDTPTFDPAKEVAAAFRKKLPIRYIVEKRVGIAIAKNRAIKEAKGDIVAIIDDDCEAHDDWIESMVKAHKRFPATIAIQGRWDHVPVTKYQCVISQFNLEYGLRAHTIFHKRHHMGISREIPIEIIATGISFKIDALKRKNIRFDESLQGFDEIDVAKQLLSQRETIMFCPEIQMYHFEREKLRTFLVKRFKTGFWKARIYERWEKYFSKWNSVWYVQRCNLFINFCLERRYPVRLSVLTLLFFLENLVYFLGYLYGRIAPKRVILHQ